MSEWIGRLSFPLFLALAITSFSPLRELGMVPSPGELGLLAWLPWALTSLFRRPLLSIPFLPLPLALLLAWLFLASACQQTFAGLLAFKQAAQFTGYFAMYLACAAWLRGGEGRADRLEASLVWMAALLGLCCFVQMVLGPQRCAVWMPWGPDWTIYYSGLGFRTYGFLDNPLLAGSLMTICLPLALARWHQGFPHRVATLVLGLGVLFTGSRSCIAVALVILASKWVGRPSRVLMGSLALPILVMAVLASPFGSRFCSLSDPLADENLANRFGASGAALHMIADAPWFGVGPGAFGEVYGAAYKPVSSQDQVSAYTTDNLLLQLTAEAGLPAGFLALAAISWAISTALRNSSWRRGLSATLIAYALLSLVVALFSTPLMWLLTVLMALGEHTGAQKKVKSSPVAVDP